MMKIKNPGRLTGLKVLITGATSGLGLSQITETFEDNSTNTITTIPTTYQLPIGRVKKVAIFSPVVKGSKFTIGFPLAFKLASGIS